MEDQQCRDSEIAGVSFSLYPMSDDFVNVIQEALAETDTSNVWMETDDVTTTARGKMVHVFDVTKAILIHAAETGEHIAFQATYSLGCPGDATGEAYLEVEESPVNLPNMEESNRYAAAKFSLYPLSEGSYMDTIYNMVEEMKKHVKVTSVHYSTKLEGDLVAMFNGLETVFRGTVDSSNGHTVMTVSFSVNSPSHQRHK